MGEAETAEMGSVSAALARAVKLIPADPATAERALRGILVAHPGELNAAIFLSRALRAQGKSRRALETLDALVAVHPNFAPAYYERALVFADRGQRDDAVAALRAAVALDPKLPNAWLVLAEHLFDAGDKTGADQAYAEHIAVSADAPHIHEAVKALHEEDLARAEKILRIHLTKLPTDIAALAVMGETMARLGNHEEAAFLLKLCLERAPCFLAARFNYASVLCQQQRADEAIAETEILLNALPDNRHYRALRATALVMHGEAAQAIPVYESLLAEAPEDAKLWAAYGLALRGVRRQGEAAAAFRRSVALDPSCGAPFWGIANFKTVRFTPDEIASMRAALARTDLRKEDRTYFHFALGKATEDDGDFAEAFASYAEGNVLRFAESPYDAEAAHANVRRLSTFFTRGRLASSAGAPAADPIFVVGLPRSGTTLIEQILDCHSAVEGVSELPELGAIVRRLEGEPWARERLGFPEGLARLDGDALRALGEDYLSGARRHRKTAKPFFVDKMPGNFEHVGLIRLILPNAKIIDARRHPLGCCFSNFKQHFANGQAWSYDLTALGRYYAGYVELMAYWDSVLPGRVHRVFHEAMVENPEREIRALLDYCGLTFEPACLNFHRNTRQVRTVSSEQVRRPIFADGVDQWRNFEPWLGPLKEALGPVLEAYPGVPASFA